jgi:SSS family solute:Na+ symporter
VIAALTIAYDLLVGVLFVPVMGAILWRRGTGGAALASIVTGAAAVVGLLFLMGIDSDAPIYGGLGLGGLVYLAFSWAGRTDRTAVKEPAVS